MALRETCRPRDTTGQNPVAAEIYRSSPYEYVVTAESTAQVFICGHAVTTPAADSFDLTGFLEQTEKDLIVRTLSATGGAQAEAARRMGLSRSALAYKLNKYGIRTTAE